MGEKKSKGKSGVMSTGRGGVAPGTGVGKTKNNATGKTRNWKKRKDKLNRWVGKKMACENVLEGKQDR